MGLSFTFVDLMLAQATPSPKATVEAARAVANIDPISILRTKFEQVSDLKP